MCIRDRNKSPVSNSTSGYIGEIGYPHDRHFPPSHSHANTGTLSYALMGVSQRGHRDRGVTIDTPSGIRVMQTFRKLPSTIPKRKNKAMTTSSTLPQDPEPLNKPISNPCPMNYIADCFEPGSAQVSREIGVLLRNIRKIQ